MRSRVVGLDLGEAPVDRLESAHVLLLEEPVREDRGRFRRPLLDDDLQGPLAHHAVREAREQRQRLRENVLLDGARERDAGNLLDEDRDLESQRGIAILERLGLLRERLRHGGRRARPSASGSFGRGRSGP